VIAVGVDSVRVLLYLHGGVRQRPVSRANPHSPRKSSERNTVWRMRVLLPGPARQRAA
jgi:hypothetical protein